ncbi:MAG: hypothetical protein ACLPND_07310 [Candidatus Korobacteraceae bacterium]
MGRELLCNARSGGKTASGKALLETNEIIFRGDLRLKIPFASLKSVVARDGELHLKWGNESAVFNLGDQAEKWAYKILHPKSTADKLGIKPGLTISAIAMSDDDVVRNLRTQAKSFSDARTLRNSDLIFLGANKTADLARVERLIQSLIRNGALWIVYPKGRPEITELHVLSAGRAAGLVDVKVVSFSATHTALKFVIPKASR